MGKRTPAAPGAEKKERIAALAHELRNCLAPLRMGLDVLRLARGDLARLDETGAMMQRQVKRMIALVDELSDTARGRVALPLSQDLPDGPASESVVEPAEPGTPAAMRQRRAQILLVEDNADMRRYIEELLSAHWDVEAVGDGAKALEVARRSAPDLVLTDVVMPKMNGFGLLRALRAQERTRATPVIMLSGRADEEARVEGLNAGADDYLVKPFGARELLARVRTHLHIASLHRQAVELAQHDPLTRLPNRTLSYEFAQRMFAGARRAGTQAAVLFIDMDRFKPINDTYGHEVGDAVLREIATRLKASVRGEDTVGRLGGDEFLAVLADVRHASDAAHAAQHLIDRLGAPYFVRGLELHTSPSIGISLFPADGGDVDTLIKNADAAMYHAKERRNNFQFYTPEMNERASQALHIESRLRGGLDQGEFELHYQPIVDVDTRAVVGAEALMRWPATGIGPEEFIAVAETSGAIERIGDWVVRESCRQARQWRERGLPALTLSINVSPLQFRQPALRDGIKRALDEHGLDPNTLQLELTETALLKNADEAIAIMQAIKELGLCIALDDFGKGYSSLNYLGKLPLDTIKVDQSFVRTIDSDPASCAITEAIVSIGKTLGLQVVAEGIESAAALAKLRDRDCQRMQGYYLCPPVPAQAFEDWYWRWQAAA